MLIYNQNKGTHQRKGEQDMTKKELAKALATEMNRINNNINIERMIKVLMKGMTTNEIESALRHHTR